jgi:ubiquinone/menaquinone biosynthesis C-methylase UbiE
MITEEFNMKVNLGCGDKIHDGWVNVDKFNYYPVDVVHDLETFPYPFEDDSVSHILMSHVLEHIGQNPDTFNLIISELYRICQDSASIDIRVPHPRHDDFISDPTHVRPITVNGLSLYDQALNKKWAEAGAANTPLGLIHNVDFKIEKVNYILEAHYKKQLEMKQITEAQLQTIMRERYNVVKEIHILWRVRK